MLESSSNVFGYVLLKYNWLVGILIAHYLQAKQTSYMSIRMYWWLVIVPFYHCIYLVTIGYLHLKFYSSSLRSSPTASATVLTCAAAVSFQEKFEPELHVPKVMLFQTLEHPQVWAIAGLTMLQPGKWNNVVVGKCWRILQLNRFHDPVYLQSSLSVKADGIPM